MRLVRWCRSVSGSVQPPRVKTDECKDLRLFPAVIRLSQNKALTSNTDGNEILLTCVLSAPLLWASGTVSFWSTNQILFPLLLPKLHSASWAWLRPGFVRKTQQPLMHSLTTSPSLSSPIRLERVEVLVFSFLKITNTELIIPYAIITHWNLMLLL